MIFLFFFPRFLFLILLILLIFFFIFLIVFLFFQILLWDTRLLPALSVENTENATLESTLWEDLPMSARRALVATVRLPSYAACARQLQLENLKMWAALDADWGASVLSR